MEREKAKMVFTKAGVYPFVRWGLKTNDAEKDEGTMEGKGTETDRFFMMTADSSVCDAF